MASSATTSGMRDDAPCRRPGDRPTRMPARRFRPAMSAFCSGTSGSIRINHAAQALPSHRPSPYFYSAKRFLSPCKQNSSVRRSRLRSIRPLTLNTIGCHDCDWWCPQGLTKGMRCAHVRVQIRGCPRNCRRIADDHKCHWGWTRSLGRWSEAITREPGNLLPVISHARTRRAGCSDVARVAEASAAWGEGRRRQRPR